MEPAVVACCCYRYCCCSCCCCHCCCCHCRCCYRCLCCCCFCRHYVVDVTVYVVVVVPVTVLVSLLVYLFALLGYLVVSLGYLVGLLVCLNLTLPPLTVLLYNTTGDTDGDGSFETTTPGIVSVSCGCSNTPALSTTPTPVLGTNATTCLAGASFSIKSDTLPDAEGCFVDTTELRHELAFYTVSGTSDVGQFWVVAIEFIEDGTPAVSIRMVTWEAWHDKGSTLWPIYTNLYT